MIRTLSLTAVLAAAIALPALAEDAKTSVEPGAGPTSTMSEKSSPAATTAAISMNEQEALTWIDKPVFSSDGKKIGKVAAVQRDPDNKVIGMHADIGGFLGFGESHVNLTPAQFKLQGDRAVLSLTAEQSKDLPKVVKL
jgi:PRC-barrel domain